MSHFRREQNIQSESRYYHIYNRGVAKQPIAQDYGDYRQFQLAMSYYIEANTATKLSSINDNELAILLDQPIIKPLVEVVSYCIMPNHLHMLLKEIEDGGILDYIRRVFNSYCHYYNIKHDRVGPLFQGRYKAKQINTEPYLLHLSRYIHLNPVMAKIVSKPEDYEWSSYNSFIDTSTNRLANPELIINEVGSIDDYRKFVEDYADYAISQNEIKDLVFDEK